MRTPLYDHHLAAGGRMVEFAGWEMPVQYTGILQEHKAVREGAGFLTFRTWGSSLLKVLEPQHGSTRS